MTTQQHDVIEVAARLEFDGSDDQMNVYQFEVQDPAPADESVTVTDLIDIMETLYQIWNIGMTILNVYRDIRIRNVTQSTLLGTFPWPLADNGDQVTDALPPGNAGLINFSTNVARVSPRKYYGGIVVANIDANGSLTVGTVSLLTAMADYLLSDITINFHRYNYGYLSPKTMSFIRPSGATVSDISAYQRRRKQGRGS